MLLIKDLTVETQYKNVILSSINMEIKKGEIIGLTGNSGSGKTTLLKSVMGVLDNNVRITKGNMLLDGMDMESLIKEKRRILCGTTIGFIPQNPMTAFNPRIKIGKQIIETFVIKLNMKKAEAQSLAESLLMDLNLNDVRRILNSYPSSLSGGMLQRIVIAILFGLNPDYIIADEPTSALDESNRVAITSLLKDKKKKSGTIFVSHDIKSMRNICDYVYVMDNGKIIESGTMEDILYRPEQDWTKKFAGLFQMEDRNKWTWKEL